MQFNRGEWSELYALLELLDNQDLNIVDDELNLIDNNTFKVLGLYVQNSNNEMEEVANIVVYASGEYVEFSAMGMEMLFKTNKNIIYLFE